MCRIDAEKIIENHQILKGWLWRRRCDRLQTAPRTFSLGFDGVPRACASQSEKQRRGANQSETGGGGATGYKRSQGWSLGERGPGFRRKSACGMASQSVDAITELQP